MFVIVSVAFLLVLAVPKLHINAAKVKKKPIPI